KEKYGLSARVVTNGLRLADEEYCKKLLATGTQVMFSFDGRSPKIYERTRKHPKALEKKLQGLENVRKYRKSKATIMCCVGEGVNDEYLADLIDYCHEGRDFIAALDLIPLVATWGPEEVDAKTSTVEDVERMMTKAIPGMEFVPAAVMYRFETLLSTFNVGRLTFGGAHPNCEMVSLLVSDAKGYHPPSRFLKRPFQEAVRDLLQLDREMGKNLKSHWISNLFGRRGQRFVYGKALWKLIRRNLDLDEIFGGSPWQGAARVGWDLLRGRKFKEVLRRHTHLHGILRVIVLPFVEQDWVESARLVDCPANFAYEHPKTKEIRLMPVCAWAIYKDDILRVTSEEYGLDHKTGQDGLTGLKNRTDIEPEAAIN
ncbi:radical SAM protein, partial [bacterium]|nr:radical SAM protein [bacterium]